MILDGLVSDMSVLDIEEDGKSTIGGSPSKDSISESKSPTKEIKGTEERI